VIQFFIVSGLRHTILCISQDRALVRVLRRTLGPLSEQVGFIDSIQRIREVGSTEPQLVILDLGTEDVEGVRPVLAEQGWSPRILALASWAEQAEALSMLDLCQCDNLIARSEQVDEAELLVTSLKLLGAGDIFGLDKYLAWGVQLRQLQVATYDEKRAAIETVSAFARSAGCRRRLVGRVEIVFDELLMNALYDAPASTTGDRAPFVSRAVPGGGPVSHQAVRVSFGCDGRFLGLSVRDAFGSLQRQTILDHLNRAVTYSGTPLTDTQRGAGLGLYFILNSVSRFVCNIEPERATEVICLFDLRKTGRLSSNVASSFHIFTTPEGAAARARV
jgi:hypothetical protein